MYIAVTDAPTDASLLLQNRLTNSKAYIQDYEYESFPAANFGVPFNVDPTATVSSAGGRRLVPLLLNHAFRLVAAECERQMIMLTSS